MGWPGPPARSARMTPRRRPACREYRSVCQVLQVVVRQYSSVNQTLGRSLSIRGRGFLPGALNGCGRQGCRCGVGAGPPTSIDESKTVLAQRMHASGESASTVAATLGVSRAMVYRVLATQPDSKGEWQPPNSVFPNLVA